MKIHPNNSLISKHIDHYWIVKDSSKEFNTSELLYAYPGVNPDLIIVLEGSYSITYLGKKEVVTKSKLYSHIFGQAILDFSNLTSFVMVHFKPRAISALNPFINKSSSELMKNPMCFASDIFGDSVNLLSKHLKSLSKVEIESELTEWFLGYYNNEYQGFLAEMVSELKDCSIQEVMRLTNYSYSTLERHFKKDTGLTPKQYHSHRRYKIAVSEICRTKNSDWAHYIQKYGYFDQSHFIREIKRFTNFTPSQLLTIPSLITVRPI